MEINQIRFAGTIERLQQVRTRTGTTMARWLLQVGRDKFKCVAFKNVAEAVLQLNNGDRISITGTGSINSWQDGEGHWHNDFQASCWAVEIAGEKIVYNKPGRKKVPPPVQQPSCSDQPPPDEGNPNAFAYQGGPF